MKYLPIVIVAAIFITGKMCCKQQEASYISNGREIRLVQGDITQQCVDAIVNAANEELAGGGGVCGALFNAAGWQELQEACNRIPEQNAIRCPTGEARITPSFNLKKRGVQHIIHAVGPDCRKIKDSHLQKMLLSKTYVNSLALAEQAGVKSIAFPFISSAIFACPKPLASTTAIDTIIAYTASKIDGVKQITFILFCEEDFALFKKILDEKLGAHLNLESSAVDKQTKHYSYTAKFDSNVGHEGRYCQLKRLFLRPVMVMYKWLKKFSR